uniref:Uncharacterized protein n=1 Tax=Trichinella nativa TaxID=6335 RepID=A0A0V1KHY5_9BILA
MVCRWPAFDPLFFSGGEAQFRDQDNSANPAVSSELGENSSPE